jgi:hypothetical protein
LLVEFSDFCNEKTLMGGEKLCWARKAGDSETADKEISVGQLKCASIAIGLTGYLAEHPIIAIGSSKNDGRSKLRLGKVRKWEWYEYYRSR